MKFKDIKPGVTYAYRVSKYGSPDKIIFLAGPEGIRLYMEAPRRAKLDEAAFTVSVLDKPQDRGDDYLGKPRHGYPAVKQLDWSEPEPDLAKVTWEDFENATVGTRTDNVRNIQFLVVVRLAYVLGPWDEVMAAEEARAQEARDAQAKAVADHRDKQERARKVVSLLQGAGVKAITLRSHGWALSIDLAEAEKLADVLGSLPIATAKED